MIVKLFQYLYKPENMIVNTFYNTESGTITYIAEKRHKAIFSVLSAFSANMGIYPFLSSDCLKTENTAFSGVLCRFGILSGCPALFPAVQYRQGMPLKYYVNRLPIVYYVNLPTYPLEYYVNRKDPLGNSWLRSI